MCQTTAPLDDMEDFDEDPLDFLENDGGSGGT